MDGFTPFLIQIINTDQPFTIMVFCVDVADERSKDGP